jgi:hypothetical protein
MAAPHGAVRPPHTSASSSTRAQSQATGRPSRRSGLPGRPGAASRRSTSRPRSAGRRSPAGLHTTSAAVPASMAPRAADRAAGDEAGPHGTRLDPVVTVARRTGCPPSLPPADARRDGCDRADGQTPDGWTPDGLDTSRPDSRVRTREPDDRTLDGLDSGRRDTWTPDGGPGWVDIQMVDADRRWTAGRHPGIPTTATRTLALGCCPEAPPGRRRLGRSATRATQHKDPAKAWLPPRPVRCRVTLQCPAGALAHTCPRMISGRG